MAVSAACGLVAAGGPRWETDLAALSPVPAASRALDAELRAAVGAAEAGQFVLVQRADADAVLRAQEALLPKLDRLVQQGVIGGDEAAAALLPSLATPAPQPGGAAVAGGAGRPVDGGRGRPADSAPMPSSLFSTPLPRPRRNAPWDLADIAGTALALRLEPLLMRRGDAWLGPIQFRGVTDLALLRVALEGTGEVFVDVRTELEGILAAFRARAGCWWAAPARSCCWHCGLGCVGRRACCGWWPPWWQRKR